MSKKNKKLVKTRKTRSTGESSDDDLSPTRRQKPKSENKSSPKISEKEDTGSDCTPSPDVSEKIGQKRKTRSQSLTSESESETDEDKLPNKSSPKSKVFKQCKNTEENKDNSEKENSGTNIKKSTSQSKNSGSENDSDEGSPQKRKTRHQKNKEESDAKEGGSDKENELLESPVGKQVINSETEADRDTDDENDDEKKNTRRNSKRIGLNNEIVLDPTKTDEPKTKSKEEVELDKQIGVDVARRTRGNIKEADEKETGENVKNEKEDESSGIKETRTTRSRVTNAEKENESPQKVEEDVELPKTIGAKRKTRSDSNASNDSLDERVDTPTRLTRGKIKSEGIQANSPEPGKRTLRKRSNSGDSKSSSISPSRSNTNSPEDRAKKTSKTVVSKDVEEDDDDGEIVLSIPKKLRNKIISENQSPQPSPKESDADEKQTLKRSTRHSDQVKDESKEENKTPKSSKTPEVTKQEKRKLSDEAENPRSAKKIALSPGNTKSTANETKTLNVNPVKNDTKNKKKLLGPKSQRKNAPAQDESDDEKEETTEIPKESNKKRKMLGPKSRRKKEDNPSDNENEDEDDETNKNNAKEANLEKDNELNSAPPTQNQSSQETDSSNPDKKTASEPVTPTTPTTPIGSFIQKKKHSKCDLKLVSLFRHELCKAKCAHCQELGKYTMHMVHFDMPQKIIQMECQSCNWTTVRRMVMTTRVVG